MVDFCFTPSSSLSTSSIVYIYYIYIYNDIIIYNYIYNICIFNILRIDIQNKVLMCYIRKNTYTIVCKSVFNVYDC